MIGYLWPLTGRYIIIPHLESNQFIVFFIILIIVIIVIVDVVAVVSGLFICLFLGIVVIFESELLFFVVLLLCSLLYNLHCTVRVLSYGKGSVQNA